MCRDLPYLRLVDGFLRFPCTPGSWFDGSVVETVGCLQNSGDRNLGQRKLWLELAHHHGPRHIWVWLKIKDLVFGSICPIAI